MQVDLGMSSVQFNMRDKLARKKEEQRGEAARKDKINGDILTLEKAFR